MSLFRDDFYTTKVRRQRGAFWRRPRRGQAGLLPVAGVSVLAGICLALLFGHWFGGGSRQAAVPAAAMSSAAGSNSNAGSGSVDDQYADRVVQASDKVSPAVVSVISQLQSDDKGQGMGLGSGVIFQKNGGKALVVTNNHVVEGGSSYEVVLSDSVHTKATLIGRDNYTDLAVLEIDASDVKAVAEFGDSSKLRPGQTAIAIGNPLGLSFSQTTTVGVISSPLRTIPIALGADGSQEWEMDVIQTDAAINQGNSGGALVSLDGKVVGINSMKIADTGVEGLGFAIPINSAKPILDALIKDHKIKRPKMGIYTEDLASFSSGLEVLKLPDDVKTGVIVTDVGEPAKSAGLKTRDVIVALDGKPIVNTMALRKYLFAQKKIGDKLEVTYYRAGKKMNVTITLTELDG